MKVLANSLQVPPNRSNIRKEKNDNELLFENHWKNAISGEKFVKSTHKHIEKWWCETYKLSTN